jgi:hypothetical protein
MSKKNAGNTGGEYVGGALDNQKVSVGMGDGTVVRLDQAELFAKLGLKPPAAVGEYTIETFGSSGPGDPDDPLTPFGLWFQTVMREFEYLGEDEVGSDLFLKWTCPGKDKNGSPCNSYACFCEECAEEAKDGTYVCPGCEHEESTR